MARRSGRKGKWLATDDYTGKTVYADKLSIDYWGNYAKKPLKRNLQEIASPLNDPQPVPFYRGPTYEHVDAGAIYLPPQYIGLTTIPTPPSLASDVMGWDVGIGEATIGYTFIVR
jgi:hypothetical protein